MEGFDHILNWTLKRGSHQFPGPDGGTCINEAALVATARPSLARLWSRREAGLACMADKSTLIQRASASASMVGHCI